MSQTIASSDLKRKQFGLSQRKLINNSHPRSFMASLQIFSSSAKSSLVLPRASLVLLKILWFCQEFSGSTKSSLVLLKILWFCREFLWFCQNFSGSAKTFLVLPKLFWFCQNFSGSAETFLVLPKFLWFCQVFSVSENCWDFGQYVGLVRVNVGLQSKCGTGSCKCGTSFKIKVKCGIRKINHDLGSDPLLEERPRLGERPTIRRWSATRRNYFVYWSDFSCFWEGKTRDF